MSRTPPSHWSHAVAPIERRPGLDRDIKADVVVVGGGFAGLAAASELATRGRSVVVLEAEEIGWGASGRNGGMMVPRYKVGFAELARRFGDDVALDLHGLILSGVANVRRTVESHSVQPGALEDVGHVTAAHSPAALKALEGDVEWLSRVAGDSAPLILGQAETSSRLGTSAYVGGYFDRRGGAIHPLAYARSLARLAEAQGATIYEGVAVARIDGLSTPLVRLANGTSVQARQVVLATGAYTSLHPIHPWLRRSFIPVRSSIVTTQPVPERALSEVLPARQPVSDTKKLMNYYRILPDNSLLFGGRGALDDRGEGKAVSSLVAAMVGHFPSIRGIGVRHAWSGLVDVSLDDFPHLGATGDIHHVVGFGGRGVVLTDVLGRLLARRICGVPSKAGPMTEAAFGPIPFHLFHSIGLRAATAWYQLNDRLAGARSHPSADIARSRILS